MTKELRSKLFTTLKVIFAVLLLIVVVINLHKELANIDFKQTFIAFGKIDRFWLVLLFLSGGASMIILSIYDVILNKSLKTSMSIWKMMRIGYIINAFNAVIGFGGFIGATVRYLVYKNYTTEKKLLVQTISVVLISMLTGLSLLSIFVVFHIFNVQHLFDSFAWVKWALYVVALFLPIFIVFTMIKPVQSKQKLLGVYCTLVSSLEWFAAASVLYLALIIVNVHVPFHIFMGVFIIAAISGLVSFIPGGFGAFDLVIILGFKSLNIGEEKIVLALLLYRFAYYFFPLLIALILSIFEFKTTAKRYFEDSKIFVPMQDFSSLFKSYQKDFLSRIPSFAIAILLFFTSILFFLNNITIIYDGLYASNHYVYYIIVSVHTCACLLLFLNVIGVYSLSKRAILFAIISLLLIVLITIYTYASFILLTWLAVMFLLLVVFYKRSKILKRKFSYLKLFYIILVSCGVLFINHLVIYQTLHKLDVYKIEVDTSILRYYFWITILVIAVIVGGIVWYFERKIKLKENYQYLPVCESIVETYGGNYLSHLMYSGDKQFFVNDNQQAFIMYRTINNAYVVLGDPIGNEKAFNDLLIDFYSNAHYIGYDIIFYQVSERYLSLYHNFGNQFFKLGEEALIDLETFTVAGKKRRGLRATLNKLSDLNMTFEMLYPPFNSTLLNALKEISDNWLDGRQEMHFSLGSFNEDYLSKAPIGIIRDEKQQPIAFCSVMPTYYNDTISVDLIRWNPQVELPLMDALYLHMLLWSKEQGYKRFNIGMATLSNVGQVPFSYTGERIAGRVFEHFNGLYRFQGLRRYKEKFKPEWEARFLVYRKHRSLWLSMLKVMKVIRKKPKIKNDYEI